MALGGVEQMHGVFLGATLSSDEILFEPELVVRAIREQVAAVRMARASGRPPAP
jgi:hypothetical protein